MNIAAAIRPSHVDPRPLRVLIHRAGSLGDTLVALPSLRLIAAAFPNSHRILLGNHPVNASAQPAARVLEGTGLIHDEASFPSGGGFSAARALFMAVRRARPDVVVALSSRESWHIALRDWLLFRLAGAPRIVGLGLFGRRLRHLDTDGQLHEREAKRLARTIRELGEIDLSHPDAWRLEPTAEDLASITATCPAWDPEADYFCIAIGTKAPSNDWGQDRWREAIQLMAKQQARQEKRLRLACIGSAEDAARSAELAALWPQGSENFCGRLSVRQTAALLSCARLLLGHDSGPMHLAAAVGTPVLAVFSRRNPMGKWFPLGNGHAQLYSEVDCAGCGLSTCHAQGNRCTRQIPAAQLADQAMIRLHTA